MSFGCICNREECFAYNAVKGNNCNCLNTVVDSGEGCSFYKMRTAKFNTNTIERDVTFYNASKS